MNLELWGILSLSFGLGILHALDADHVIAITGLSCKPADRKTSILYCTNWALGHGGVLLLIGSAVMFLGIAIPQNMSMFAESAIGIVLIIIGLMVLWNIYRQQAHLHFHSHQGMSHHAHWHSHKHSNQDHRNDNHQHNHAPVLVGVLHGFAGSAPLMALLPLSQISSPWLGMLYLLLFGAGVFISMLVFGGVIGQLFGWMKRWGNNFINGLRFTVSFMSIAYGLKLIMVSI